MAVVRKFLVFFSVLFLVISFISGCGSSGGGSGITVTFSPADGATDVAVDAAITATFSAAITEPADWSTVFTLILEGTGLPLCTAVTYDAASLTATCAHADLGLSSNYIAAISGLTGVNDTTATFTTTSTATVTGFSKTSVTTPAAGSGETTLTFTLDTALPAGTTPTLTMSAGTAGACAVSADGLTVTCPVTGLAGCSTATDYIATLSGGDITEYSVRFNSADDEFTSGDTITNTCYTINTVPFTADDIANGLLNISFTDQNIWRLRKTLSDSAEPDMTQVLYLVTFVPAVAAHNDAMGFAFRDDDAGTAYSEGFASFSYVNNGAIIALDWGYPDPAWLKAGADLALMNASVWPETAQVAQGLYYCMVHKDAKINFYLSTDGTTYTRLEASNMTCTDYPGSCDVAAAVTDVTTADWNGLYSALTGAFVTNADSLTATIDFVRFGAAPTGDGTVDCANLTAY